MLSVAPSIDTRVCEAQTHKISDAITQMPAGLDVAETGLLARSVWVIRPDGAIVYRELVEDQTREPDHDALLGAIRAAST